MKYFSKNEMKCKCCGQLPDEALLNGEALVDNVLDPVRTRYGKAVHVSSGYRCQQLNTLIHGALESQHLKGEAADIYTDAGPQGNLELAKLIIASGKFDQVILENVPGTSLMPQWVHVSWKRNGVNRGEIRKKVMGSSSYPLLSSVELNSLKGRGAAL